MSSGGRVLLLALQVSIYPVDGSCQWTCAHLLLGNHAQGVAFSARKLRIPATIVMPSGTPAIKHLNVARLGGSVVLHGNDFDAAKDEAHRLEKQHGLTNIPPFDDPYVIAGQGTIGMELL